MNNKLVSVCVITYNSAETVLDTLNSIKNQTYSPIELIISDDNSTDNTVNLVNEWLDSNSDIFVNTKVITSEKNTGVTANVNRACKAANGYYIKDIAGDDMLFSSYLQNCISYMNENPEIEILFTKMKFIDEENNEIMRKFDNINFFKLTAEEQFKEIVKYGPAVPTPSIIYTKKLMEKLNYFDERIPMWEDGPFYFKATRNNYKLFLLDSVETINRLRHNSLSHEISPSHKKSIALYYFYYVKDYDKPILKKIKNIVKFSLFYFSNINFINSFINKKLKE